MNRDSFTPHRFHPPLRRIVSLLLIVALLSQIYPSVLLSYPVYSDDLPPGPQNLQCQEPLYCSTEDCPCGENDEECICAAENPSCLCLRPLNPCTTPTQCQSDECRCDEGEFGKEKCICDDDCLCQAPQFVSDVKTYFTHDQNKDLQSIDIASGLVQNLDIYFSLSSTEALFSNVRFITYIQTPLEPYDLFMEGEYVLDGNPVQEGMYTAVRIRSTMPISNSFSGMYTLKVRFPAGTTANDSLSSVYTRIEGMVIDSADDAKQWPFKTTSNDTNTLTLKALADSAWDISLKNVALDYKDPDDKSNIFRYQVSLNRDTDDQKGYINISESSALAVYLPIGSGEHPLSVLRVTDANGANLLYGFDPSSGCITLDSDQLFSSWQPWNDRDNYMTSDSNSDIYIVFTLPDEFLASVPKDEIGTGNDKFTIYRGLEGKAEFLYHLVCDAESVLNRVEDTEPLQIIGYNPGTGGHGSIDKWAEPFIEGKNFFKASDDSELKPISFSLYYANNSNTSVKDLYISDFLPTAYSLAYDDLSGVSNLVLEPQLQQYLRFHSVTLTSWNADQYAELSTGETAHCYLYAYSDADALLTGYPKELTPGDPIVFGTADQPAYFSAKIDHELKHGFSMRLNVQVAGDPSLATVENKNTRDKIQFVQNQAAFNATSSKDNTTPLANQDSFLVHVYPFDDKIEKMRWSLKASVRSLDGTYGDDASIDEATVTRGREFYYRLKVTPANKQQYIYSPAFYLVLPPEVTYLGFEATGSAASLGLQANLLSNPFGSGQLLVLEATSKQLLHPESESSIEIRARLNAEASYGATIESRAFFTVKDPNTQLDETWKPDKIFGQIKNLETNPSAETADLYVLEDKVRVKIDSSGRLEGELWIQSELDREQGTWRRHPEQAEALPGGLLNYKFVVRNGGTLDAENIELFNVFSCPKDNFIIIGGGERNSKWQPYLTGPVKIDDSIGAVVYYSENSDHTVTINGKVGGTDDWTLEPYEYTGVQALRIVIPGKLKSGESLEIDVPMYAPVDFTIDPSEKQNNIAVSSLATRFNFVSKITQALEPLKVSVALVENEKGEISGRVWNDVDSDGIWNADEFPYAQAVVDLYKDGGHKRSVIGDSYGSYKLTNLDAGDYELRIAVPQGYTIVDKQNDNDYDKASGYIFYPFTITGNTIFTDIDAALCPPKSTISGTVWRSLDGESERSDTSANPHKDIGLQGVTVAVYRMLGKGASQHVADTTTGIDGGYTFNDIPSGRYYVLFTPLTNYTPTERMAAPTTTGSPSNPDHSQAQPSDRASNGERLGQSYEIWLSGADVTGIDCGLVPKRGSISGTIWHDLNGDGTKDSGDAGLAGMNIKLTKTSDTWGEVVDAGITVSTGQDGSFSFSDLSPGTYTLSLDTATEECYASYVLGQGIDNRIAENDRLMVNSIANIEIAPDQGDLKLKYDNHNFGLVKKFAISGTVFNDKDYSEDVTVGDENLSYLANAVQLQRGTETPVYASAGTGSFSFTGLWPGSYTLTFLSGCVDGSDADGTAYDTYLVTTSGSGFNSSTRTWTLSNITSSNDQAYKDLGLTRPRSISGLAWNDKNGDGTLDGTEGGMGQLLTLGGAATATYTNDSGYLFSGLYPGSYTVTVAIPTNPDTYVLTNADGATLKPDGATKGVYTLTIPKADNGSANDPKNVNFGLARPITLNGRIWLDSDTDPSDDYASNGSYDTGGTAPDIPLAIANVVQLYRHNGTDYLPYTPQFKASSAADSGLYSFTNLPPGNYQIEMKVDQEVYYVTGPAVKSINPLNGHSDATFSTSASDDKPTWSNIRLDEGQTLSNLDLSLGQYHTISGLFWHDLNGDGIKDASSSEGPYTPASEADTLPVTLLRKAASSEAYDEFATVNSSQTDGTYSFSKLKPGAYQVKYISESWRITNQTANQPDFRLENQASVGYAAYWSVLHDLPAVAAHNDKDFYFSVYSNIYGTVWLDTDADAVNNDSASLSDAVYLSVTYQAGPFPDWFANTYPEANKVSTPAAAGSENPGQYSFPDLWPGTYVISLHNAGDYLVTNSGAAGPADGVLDHAAQTWTLNVHSSNQYQNLDFGLVKPLRLSGQLWRDSNADRLLAADEPAISGSTLTLTRLVSGDQNGYQDSKTLSTKEYSFADLYPGNYTLEAQLPAGSVWLSSYYATAALAPSNGSATIAAYEGQTPFKEMKFSLRLNDTSGDGASFSEANFGYTVGSSISGRIFHDKNGNGAEESGDGVLNVVYAALKRVVGDTYESSFAPRKITGTSLGSFDFSELLPGSYQLSFSGDQDYLVTTASTSISDAAYALSFDKESRLWNLRIHSDAQNLQPITGMVYTGSISGSIWHDLDADASWDSNEVRLTETVTVALYNTASQQIGSDVVSSDGNFSFSRLFPGTYTVKLSTPSSGSWYFSNTGSEIKTNPATLSAEIGNVKAAAYEGLDFGLTQPFRISGRIWDDKVADGVYRATNDALFSSVSLALYRGSDTDAFATTTTDAQGYYRFDDLIPGSYSVLMNDSRYTSRVLTNTYSAVGDNDSAQYLRFEPSDKQWQMKRLSGDLVTDCDFALSDKSVLRGNIWLDRDGDGLVSVGEAAYENLTLALLQSTDGGQSYNPTAKATTSGSSGDYLFILDTPGSYRVQLTLPGADWGVTNTVAQQNYWDVTLAMHGQSRDDLDFGLARYIALGGFAWTERDGDGSYSSGNAQESPLGIVANVYHGSDTTPFATLSSDSSSGLWALARTEKLLPGPYRIVYNDKADHLVSNRADGFDPQQRTWQITLASGEEAHALNCGFTPKRSLSLLVWNDKNGDGASVGEASYGLIREVVLSCYDDLSGQYLPVTLSDTLYTDASGQLAVNALYPGLYRTRVVEEEAYLHTNPASGLPLYTAAYTLDDSVETNSASAQIGLARTIRLQLHSYLDKDSDGHYDAAKDAPLSVTGSVYRKQVSSELYDEIFTFTTSDAAGSYDTLGQHRLEPGLYRVIFAAYADHEASTTNAELDPASYTWSFSLSDAESKELSLGYKRSIFRITGEVWKDDNGDALKSTDENPFERSDNVEIWAYEPLLGIREYVYAEDDGLFSLDLPMPGTYQLSVVFGDMHDDLGITNRSDPYDKEEGYFEIELDHAHWQYHQEIGAAKALSISGYLFLDYNADGICQGPDQRLSEMKIQLVELPQPQSFIGAGMLLTRLLPRVEAETTTGPDGSYSFGNVKPGSYSIILADLGGDYCYTGYNGDNPPSLLASAFDLRSGAWQLQLTNSNIINANSGYCAPSVIVGELFNETLQSYIVDQIVELYRLNSQQQYELWQTGQTDAQGGYQFDRLLPGQYQLRLSVPDGYRKTDSTSADQQGSTLVFEHSITAPNSRVEEQAAVQKPHQYTPPISPNGPGNGGGTTGTTQPDDTPSGDDKKNTPDDTTKPGEDGKTPSDTHPQPDEGETRPPQPDAQQPDGNADQPKQPDGSDGTTAPPHSEENQTPGDPDGTRPQDGDQQQPPVDGDSQPPYRPDQPQHPDAGSILLQPGITDRLQQLDLSDVAAGSFIGIDGTVYPQPMGLQKAQGEEGTLLEMDDDGDTVLRIWRAVTIDGEAYYLLDDIRPASYLPATGDPVSLLLRTAQLMLLLSLLYVGLALTRRASAARKRKN